MGLVYRLVIFVVVPLLLLAGSAWRHLVGSLPTVRGEIAVRVSAPVDVARDANGVPRIVARTDRDAFHAIGYAHAQDRMWQLEVQRRIATGRLSEIFGKDGIKQDVWFRTLGLAHSARSAWQSLGEPARESLQAYADGINDWLASDPVLPVEFSAFGFRPEPWTVYDSLAWAKVFALDLGGNYSREIERLVVARSAPPGTLQALFPDGADDRTRSLAALDGATAATLQSMADFHHTLQTRLGIGGRFVGSNAWAVSGRLTTDGAALLANDPHLSLQIPSLWYMAELKGDRIDVAGATLVGLPLVIFGRNADVAWGGTNLMADAQDLYLEQVKSDDSDRYAVGDTWATFSEREEFIRVKQDFPALLRSPLKPLRVLVRSSRHGPIVSDAFHAIGQPAALRWTALDADDTSYDAFFHLNYAHDWATFQDALRLQVAPALNFVYADRGGNVGYLAAGRIPVRAGGDGTLPVPGWTDAYEWIANIPPEAMPRQYNPDAGFVVSANEKPPVAADYPYRLGSDFADPARAERIATLLREGSRDGRRLDLAAMRAIQGDTRSEPARRLLARLMQHAPSSDAQRRAYEYFGRWQGDMAGDSQAASIFNAWTRHLKRQLLQNDLVVDWTRDDDNATARGVIDNVDTDVVLRLLDDGEHRWCSVREAVSPRPLCDDLVNASLNRALRELTKIDSDASMRDWAWADVHATQYRHVPFSDVKVARSLFERRIGSGGSPDSVNVANFTLKKSGYVQDFGAGFRQLVALSPQRTEHRYMNSTGQSGNVMSPHYDDMVERFRDVADASMPGTAGQGTAGEGGDVLRLVPTDGKERTR